MNVILARLGKAATRLREWRGRQTGIETVARTRPVQLNRLERELLLVSEGMLVFGGDLARNAEHVFQELEEERIQKLTGI